jgi:hypothetical protein
VRHLLRGVRPSSVVVLGRVIRVPRMLRIVSRPAFGVSAADRDVERGARRVRRHRRGVGGGWDIVHQELAGVLLSSPLVRWFGLCVNGESMSGCPSRRVVGRTSGRVASGAQRVNSCSQRVRWRFKRLKSKIREGGEDPADISRARARICERGGVRSRCLSYESAYPRVFNRARAREIRPLVSGTRTQVGRGTTGEVRSPRGSGRTVSRGR